MGINTRNLIALTTTCLAMLLSSCNSSSSFESSISSPFDSSSVSSSSSLDSSSSLSESLSISSSSEGTESTTSICCDSSSTSEDIEQYSIVNGTFETGDLYGWTVVSGNAFSAANLSNFENVSPSISYGKNGQFFLKGGADSQVGKLKSSSFIIGGSGYISFQLGAAYSQALTYISIVDSISDIELFRFGHSAFNNPIGGEPSLYRVENLVSYVANLSLFKTRSVYVLLVDQSTANYGYLNVDSFVTYYGIAPSLNGKYLAVNIAPIFPDLAGTPSALYNGSFSTRTLQGWTVVGETGVFQDSHINANHRLSNRPNESLVGVLRSSSFKVAGQQIVSLRLGATKHPDLTYLSIKQVGTNEEIFRTYSSRWHDADEENTHIYYIDLSQYENTALYFEIVDNSRADWGLVTLEQITTFYLTMPSVMDEVAVNILDSLITDPTFASMRSYVDPLFAAIEDEATRLTVIKTFYASLDGFTIPSRTYPSVMNYNTDGTVFVITGDINAMWLRDSSAQVLPYLQFMNIDEDVRLLVKGLLRKQFEFLRRDPYANAFNPNGTSFERKFEIDSLVYPLWLADQYFTITGDTSIFDSFFALTLTSVITTLENERAHSDTNYRISNQTDRDAGPHEVNINSGLIWSGYRPSDDVNYYKFFIPGNMFAVATMEKMVSLLTSLNRFESLKTRAQTIATEVRAAIETYATYNHPSFGKIYAFEVNGMSSDVNSNSGKLLMDAANIPSLLSAPWLGYLPETDTTYQNTRDFALSASNPYFYQGTYASGIGDPHDLIGGTNPHLTYPVPWHMAIAMQGLTTSNEIEVQTMIDYMVATTNGTYVMHEAFNANNPGDYTRDWFTWPCALFAHLYITKILNVNLEGQ